MAAGGVLLSTGSAQRVLARFPNGGTGFLGAGVQPILITDEYPIITTAPVFPIPYAERPM